MNTLKIGKEDYLDRWKSNGGKTTFYTCNHCKQQIETRQPTKDLVSSKGYWDSVTSCSKCDGLNFVKVYPSGKTKSILFGK